MPFILSEDLALKQRLQGMTVSDGNTPQRGVGVWFGQPDRELRAQDYPYIVINLIDVDIARERVHSDNPVTLDYLEPPVDLEEGQTVLWNRPIPVNLDYQVSTFSRHPRHDRQILGQLLRVLPMRGAVIGVTHENPEEGTGRRLDFLGLAKQDRVEEGKRLFINAATVRISSEMYPDGFKILQSYPSSINFGFNGYVNPGGSTAPWGDTPGVPDPENPTVPPVVDTAPGGGLTITGV